MLFSHNLLRALQNEVVGQDYALTALTRAVTLALSGRRSQNRPLSVLLFAGPAAAGKTHVGTALARVLLGDERRVITINCQQLDRGLDPMSNLKQQLIAGWCLVATSSPPVPSPFNIVIFEEIAKAPAALRESLATAIDRGGLLTDTYFFPIQDAFIIMTTTLSKKQTDQLLGRTIGFFKDGEAAEELPRMQALALEEMDTMLGTHLVSRTDEIIFFERLMPANVLDFLDKELLRMRSALAVHSVGLVVDADARSYLLSQGVEDLAHGMRQIKRVLRNLLEFPLADLVLSGRLFPGTAVEVKYEPPGTFLHFQILIPYVGPSNFVPTEGRAFEAPIGPNSLE
ncbi:MAG TPA: AAA family ATPase [Blastocatellia bacterium]|nr:AAA family ATPase [Blastocatellia bacterium]